MSSILQFNDEVSNLYFLIDNQEFRTNIKDFVLNKVQKNVKSIFYSKDNYCADDILMSVINFFQEKNLNYIMVHFGGKNINSLLDAMLEAIRYGQKLDFLSSLIDEYDSTDDKTVTYSNKENIEKSKINDLSDNKLKEDTFKNFLSNMKNIIEDSKNELIIFIHIDDYRDDMKSEMLKILTLNSQYIKIIILHNNNNYLHKDLSLHTFGQDSMFSLNKIEYKNVLSYIKTDIDKSIERKKIILLKEEIEKRRDENFKHIELKSLFVIKLNLQKSPNKVF